MYGHHHFDIWLVPKAHFRYFWGHLRIQVEKVGQIWHLCIMTIKISWQVASYHIRKVGHKINMKCKTWKIANKCWLLLKASSSVLYMVLPNMCHKQIWPLNWAYVWYGKYLTNISGWCMGIYVPYIKHVHLKFCPAKSGTHRHMDTYTKRWWMVIAISKILQDISAQKQVNRCLYEAPRGFVKHSLHL